MKRLTIIGIVFFGIVFTGFMGFAQDFQSSDLEGAWQLYMFETDPVAGSSYYAYGSFTADESGNITAGTYIPPVGPAINVAGGILSLDDDGILSGSIDAEGGIKITFPSGKLDADKNILTYVANPSTGAMDFGFAVKDGGSFSTSDLEGTWHVYLMETNPVAGTYWINGTFIVDASGKVSGGTYNAPDGTTVTVTGGSVTLDSSGVMSGTVDAEGGLTGTFPSGKLNTDKNIITFIGNDTNGSMDLGVAIKSGGSFSTSDLEGTWYVYMMEANPVAGSYWLYGSFTVDDSGKVTGGTYNAPDGTTVAVKGGSVSLDSNGVMSGTVDAEGGLTGTFPSGKLDTDKNIIAFVGSDTNMSMDLGIAVRAGLPQSTGDNTEGDANSGGGGGGGNCFISTMKEKI